MRGWTHWGRDWTSKTIPGEDYVGQLQAKNRKHFIMRSTGDFVVGYSQDLPKGSSAGDTVKVTASQPPSAAQEKQMQR